MIDKKYVDKKCSIKYELMEKRCQNTELTTATRIMQGSSNELSTLVSSREKKKP